MLFSVSAVPYCISAVSVPGSRFSTSSPALTLSCSLVFDHGCSARGEVTSHCGFDLPLPVDLRHGASAHAPLGR